MLNFQDLAKITVEAIHENKEEVGLIDEKGGKRKPMDGFHLFDYLRRIYSFYMFYMFWTRIWVYETQSWAIYRNSSDQQLSQPNVWRRELKSGPLQKKLDALKSRIWLPFQVKRLFIEKFIFCDLFVQKKMINEFSNEILSRLA